MTSPAQPMVDGMNAAYQKPSTGAQRRLPKGPQLLMLQKKMAHIAISPGNTLSCRPRVDTHQALIHTEGGATTSRAETLNRKERQNATVQNDISKVERSSNSFQYVNDTSTDYSWMNQHLAEEDNDEDSEMYASLQTSLELF